jgi:hypothetical protein
MVTPPTPEPAMTKPRRPKITSDSPQRDLVALSLLLR